MEITWYGHSCFRITERGQTTVITDPYDETIGLPPLKLRGDVVTISHETPGHGAAGAIKGEPFVINSPGEFEIGGTFIYGYAMHHVDENTGFSRRNVAYLIDYPTGLNVLHLGDLSHVPDQRTIQGLGQVNVVLVPVGGGNSLKASTAAEVIALIEPQYIVPMHYQIPGLKVELEPVEKFLKAMGVSRVHEDDALRVTTNELPEQPQIVVLNLKAE